MYGTLVVKMASWSVELERLHLDILQFAHGTRMHFSVKICTCRPRTRNYDSKGPLVSHLSHGLHDELFDSWFTYDESFDSTILTSVMTQFKCVVGPMLAI